MENQNKKKIILVNNNMKIGGVQKALLDLLNEISSRYDVTLYLLNRTGEYLDQVPKTVTILGGDTPYKYFGMSQAESKKSKKDHLLRSFFATVTKLFKRNCATRLIRLFTQPLPKEYDCAIAYMQDAGERLLYGGCNDFVLSKVHATNKVTFVHCDYENSGNSCKINNAVYPKFHHIVACSDGCRRAFLKVLPHLESKTKTVINCHNFKEILSLSQENPIVYEKPFVHAAIVARLSKEKGIERALYAARYVLNRIPNFKLHIIGGGNQETSLLEICQTLGLCDHVIFYGEQKNPYRYLKNADLLLIPSFHEAAPLVIDEALCLGVPILSTKTTSSEDMITRRNCGWVCDNTQDGLNTALYDVISHPDQIRQTKQTISTNISCDNRIALDMLQQVLR